MVEEARLVEFQSLEGHSDRVWAVSWSSKDDLLASCSGDKHVRIWAKRPGENGGWFCTAVLEEGHTKTVRSVHWSPNGRYLATASFDATVAIWRLQNGDWEQVTTLEGHENEVKCVAWSPDGSLLATCGRDRTVWIWESLPGNEFEVVDVKHGHGGDVKHVAWHPGGEVLASCSYDDSIKLWCSDGDDWTCAQTLQAEGGEGHTATVWCVAFDPEGRQMASCSDDGTIKVWSCSMEGRQPAYACSATIDVLPGRSIFTVDWSRSNVIAAGDADNFIRLYVPNPTSSAPTSTSTPPAVAGGPAEDALMGSPSPSHAEAEERRAAAATASPCGAWLSLVSRSQAHTSDVNCVQWHPDASSGLLASGGDDGCVKLWRLERSNAS